MKHDAQGGGGSPILEVLTKLIDVVLQVMVVLGRKLDSITSEVFCNPDDSMILYHTYHSCLLDRTDSHILDVLQGFPAEGEEPLPSAAAQKFIFTCQMY